MNQKISGNGLYTTKGAPGNIYLNAINNSSSKNNMSASGISQDSAAFLGTFASKRQHHGGVAGVVGNTNNNVGNSQAGAYKLNNGNGLGNFNVQQSAQMNKINNCNAMMNANALTMADFVKLQQQLQQQQMQQQMKIQQQMKMQQQVQQQMQLQQQQLQQQQLQQQQQQQMKMQMQMKLQVQMKLQQQQQQQQQLQAAANMKNFNPQNINLALMAAQQNQKHALIGQKSQFGGGGALSAQGQANMHPNLIFNQFMMNKNLQPNGIEALGNLPFANISGAMSGNHVVGAANAAVPHAVGGAGTNALGLTSTGSLFHRDASRRMRGGVIEPFPEKLHRLLVEVEGAGRADVISFVANGRAFAIHKADIFFKEIVPLYFRQSRLSSFKRQLNLYGFELINTGPARGGYYHELFVKERPELCRQMRRVAIKLISGKEEAKAKVEKVSKSDDSNLEDDISVLSGDEEGKTGDVEEGTAKVVTINGNYGGKPKNVSTNGTIAKERTITETSAEKENEKDSDPTRAKGAVSSDRSGKD